MTGAAVLLMFSSLFAVALVRVLPGARGLDGVALLTVITLAALSPASALWLVGTTLVTVLIIRHGRAQNHRGLMVALYGSVLVFLLFVSREYSQFFWIGGAYFTLRHLHVLMDWWMGRLSIPTVSQYLRYSFFLPVLMAGPINRLGQFQRQERRQRISSGNLFAGAERALFGLGQAVLISSWGLQRLHDYCDGYTRHWAPFPARWIDGSFEWLQLYFSFSGLTSLALGLSLMMGLKLEENFNRPWAAGNLVDFWSRWHMTLSNWCRDYVFYPITAVTRTPLIGLLTAMFAMGLWHDSSAYYVLWALWQSLGIFMTHMALRLPAQLRNTGVAKYAGPVSVLLWLTLTRPIVMTLLDLLPS